MIPSPVVVCIGSSRQSAALITAAAEKARALGVPLHALNIVKPSASVQCEPIEENLAFAQSLGARVITRQHQSTTQGIIEYANALCAIDTLFVGHNANKFWQFWCRRDAPSQKKLKAEGINVHVVELERNRQPRKRTLIIEYSVSALAVIATTTLLYTIRPLIAEADVIMAYLATVVVLAYSFNRGPSLFAAIFSVAAFDFFFVPPFLTFAVDHEKYLISFAVMAAMGFMFNSFSERLKKELRDTSKREAQLRDLYHLARALAAASTTEEIFNLSRIHIASVCEARVDFFAQDGSTFSALGANPPNDGNSLPTAEVSLCFKEARLIKTTDDSGLTIHCAPVGFDETQFVLVLRSTKPMDKERDNLLHTCLSLVNLSVARTQFAEQAKNAEIHAESEQLRNAILSAVSHDLRTPLGTIMGLASTLLDKDIHLDGHLVNEFITTIYDVSEQLSQKVTNLLQMSRTLSGKLTPKIDLQNPEEFVGGTLAKLKHRLAGVTVETQLDETLLIPIDIALMEVVLSNLLDNAVKFSPENSKIVISGYTLNKVYALTVEDQGCGLASHLDNNIFEQFYRVENRELEGMGLGLAISKSIIEAHGGKIAAENNLSSGAKFTVLLPLRDSMELMQNHE